jgi:hypothetical protein
MVYPKHEYEAHILVSSMWKQIKIAARKWKVQCYNTKIKKLTDARYEHIDTAGKKWFRNYIYKKNTWILCLKIAGKYTHWDLVQFGITFILNSIVDGGTERAIVSRLEVAINQLLLLDQSLDGPVDRRFFPGEVFPPLTPAAAGRQSGLPRWCLHVAEHHARDSGWQRKQSGWRRGDRRGALRCGEAVEEADQGRWWMGWDPCCIGVVRGGVTGEMSRINWHHYYRVIGLRGVDGRWIWDQIDGVWMVRQFVSNRTLFVSVYHQNRWSIIYSLR